MRCEIYRRVILLYVASVLSLTSHAGTGEKPIRVAVVAEGVFADLAVAELSLEPGIELIDRAEVVRVLGEREYAGSLLDGGEAISLSGLLPADLFVAVDFDEAGEVPFGVVVFDSRTGVRYSDKPLPAEETKDAVRGIVEAVRVACAKRRLAEANNLVNVSLLSVRNVDLPKFRDPFCEAVGALLVRSLGMLDTVAVLERGHLDWLNRERHLPGMDWSSKLLGSAVLLELDVRADEGGVRLTVSDNMGRRVVVDESGWDVSKAVSGLAAQIAEYLSAGSGLPSLEGMSESRRFLYEYRLLLKHNRKLDAHRKIAAAYALNPELRRDYVDGTLALANSIFHSKPSDAGTEFDGDRLVDLYEMALDICTGQDGSESALNVVGLHFAVFERSTYSSDNLFERPDLSRFSAAQMARLEDMHTRWLVFDDQCLRGFYFKDGGDPERDAEAYRRFTRYTLSSIALSKFFNKRQWLANACSRFADWVEMSERFARESNDETPIRAEFLAFIPDLIAIGECYLDDVSGREADALFARMSESTLPFLVLVSLDLSTRRELVRELKAVIGGAEAVRERNFFRFWEGWKSYYSEHKDAFSANEKWILGRVLQDRLREKLGRKNSGYREILLDICEFKLGLGEFHPDLYYSLFVMARGEEAMEIYRDYCRMMEGGHEIVGNTAVRNRNLMEERLGVGRVMPWRGAEMLYKVQGGETIVMIAAEGDHAYLGIFLGGSKELVFYRREMSSGGELEQLAGVEFELDKSSDLLRGNYFNPPYFHASFASDQLLVSTFNGIYVVPKFPGDTKDAVLLNTGTGLPSDFVQSAASCGDRIIAVVGGRRGLEKNSIIYVEPTYVVGITPGSWSCKTLASTMAKDRGSLPFASPFTVADIVADQDRERVLMLVGYPEAPYGGLWEYKPEKDAWRSLWVSTSPLMICDDNISWNDGRLIVSTSSSCYEFSPEDDSINMIISAHPRDSLNSKLKPIAGMSSIGGTQRCVVGDEVWFGNNSYRRRLEKQELEHFEFPKEVRPVTFIRNVGGERILVGGGNSAVAVLFLGEEGNK